MDSSSDSELVDTLSRVLHRLNHKGVRLWLEGGAIRYSFPTGALAPEEGEFLRKHRRQLMLLLESDRVQQFKSSRVSHFDKGEAPLTWAQLAHWHLYRLYDRRVPRGVAFATRIRGRLNLDTFRAAIVEVTHRHDALRTRIATRAGGPIQLICESPDWKLQIDDLTNREVSNPELIAINIAERFLNESINVLSDPLFGIKLIVLNDNEYVLLVSMEHMISDGVSKDVLMHDLFAIYDQTLLKKPITLPSIRSQPAELAFWQRSQEVQWIKSHMDYWNAFSRSHGRLKLSRDSKLQEGRIPGWRRLGFKLDSQLTTELREWSRLKNTTVVMAVFTAFAALVMRWCDVRETSLQYEMHGRANQVFDNAVGYFASALNVRVAFQEGDDFVDLLNTVVKEYCIAYEHADFSYLESHGCRPGFTRNTCFNWIPYTSVKRDSNEMPLQDRLLFSPFQVDDDQMLVSMDRDTEPMIGFVETANDIDVLLYFSAAQFSTDTGVAFGRNFVSFLRVLTTRPQAEIRRLSVA